MQFFYTIDDINDINMSFTSSVQNNKEIIAIYTIAFRAVVFNYTKIAT